MLLFVFFFFKQKTAYDNRISDWSSDVCSSALPSRLLRQGAPRGWPIHEDLAKWQLLCQYFDMGDDAAIELILLGTGSPLPDANRAGPSALVLAGPHRLLVDAGRSEERRVGKERVSTCRSRGSPYH